MGDELKAGTRVRSDKAGLSGSILGKDDGGGTPVFAMDRYLVHWDDDSKEGGLDLSDLTLLPPADAGVLAQGRLNDANGRKVAFGVAHVTGERGNLFRTITKHLLIGEKYRLLLVPDWVYDIEIESNLGSQLGDESFYHYIFRVLTTVHPP